jgi:hypothetical protein
VLERLLDYFRDRDSIDAISADDLTGFVVSLKKDHSLGSNTILHNAVIFAQFLKRHGRSGITRALPLPERITPRVKATATKSLLTSLQRAPMRNVPCSLRFSSAVSGNRK